MNSELSCVSFSSLGDLEQKFELEISPLCNQQKDSIPSIQIGELKSGFFFLKKKIALHFYQESQNHKNNHNNNNHDSTAFQRSKWLDQAKTLIVTDLLDNPQLRN